MLSRRLLFAAACLFGFADYAAADVNGQTYAVRSGFRAKLFDIYTFTNDGGDPNEGPFATLSGGTGRWEQTVMGSIALWSASFNDGEGLRVDVSGIQFGMSIIGTGSSNEEDFFLILPGPITARGRGGSAQP